MKRHISPLSRHLSDAYKDVRGVKVTTKGGKYALHRPCCLPYTDAKVVYFRMQRACAGIISVKGGGNEKGASYQERVSLVTLLR